MRDYKIESVKKSSSKDNINSRDDHTNFIFYVIIAIIGYAIINKCIISYKANQLSMAITHDLAILYSRNNVNSDFHQNSLTDEYLTNILYNIDSKKNFKIFMAALNTDNGFFTNQNAKDTFLNKAKIYAKSHKL